MLITLLILLLALMQVAWCLLEKKESNTVNEHLTEYVLEGEFSEMPIKWIWDH